MTDEERQELETLRAEKHSREQTERARNALTAAGVPQSFAPCSSAVTTRTPTSGCGISAEPTRRR